VANDTALDYRVGLTHLRALSVVLVVLFHAGLIDGGFVGVDVFFVLSGFLISNLLWIGLSSSRPVGSVLGAFYARRALRLLPLSLLVLSVTAIAGRLFFDTLTDNWVTSGRAAAVWVQNWFLIRESNDYFASEGTNPFQHYWSLGVEEQFYVVLPLLLAGALAVLRPVAERAKLAGIGILATLGVVAALAAEPVLGLSAAEAYYSSLVRSYQLLTGVVIMVAIRLFGWREDRRWLAAVGSVALVAVAAGPEMSLRWTGIAATVAAALCVASSRAVLVQSRALERIGIWSYGIYLWHFSISEYLVNERLDTPPLVVFAITMAASTALAALSYRFFENPIRHLKLPKPVTFGGAALAIAAVWVGLGLLRTPVPEPTYVDTGEQDQRAALPVEPDGTVDASSISTPGRLAAADVTRMEGWMPLDGTAVSRCGLRDTGPSCIDLDGRPRVMLLGDSFANRIYQGLRPLAEQEGWGLSAYVRPGCPWMDDVINDVGNDISERCAQDKALQDQAIAELAPDVVVIHSYPYREANDKMTRLSTGEKLSPAEVADAAQATIDRLVDAGIEVVYVEPTPFAADGSNVDECLKVATWADECAFESIDVDSPLNEAMRRRAEEDPRVRFASMNELFCEDLACEPTLGDLAVMADSTHVSGGAWLKVRGLLRQPISEALAAR
jgi:peptidoglycan/LPS O-acetylase OafA/YrhL